MSVTDTNIAQDYHTLSRDYKLEVSDSGRRLIIKNFNYPAGWQPRPAPLLIRYPDYYPRMQPAIYLPAFMEYTQGSVSHRFLTDTLDDGSWIRWCTHELPWHQDITHFLDYWIRPSFANPNASNPAALPTPPPSDS